MDSTVITTAGTASSNMFPTILFFTIITLVRLATAAAMVYLFILLVKALRKYLESNAVVKENETFFKSLGEALKAHRTECKMTQEFVAEHLGVSRQAVSKWENGTADPSTSNLLALAKLYGISAEELLKEIQE